MICPINSQGFYGDQWGLVTAIVLGFFFGFSLHDLISHTFYIIECVILYISNCSCIH